MGQRATLSTVAHPAGCPAPIPSSRAPPPYLARQHPYFSPVPPARTLWAPPSPSGPTVSLKGAAWHMLAAVPEAVTVWGPISWGTKRTLCGLRPPPISRLLSCPGGLVTCASHVLRRSCRGVGVSGDTGAAPGPRPSLPPSLSKHPPPLLQTSSLPMLSQGTERPTSL